MAGQSFGPRRSSPPGPGPARKLEPRRTFPSVSTTTKRTKRKEQKKHSCGYPLSRPRLLEVLSPVSAPLPLPHPTQLPSYAGGRQPIGAERLRGWRWRWLLPRGGPAEPRHARRQRGAPAASPPSPSTRRPRPGLVRAFWILCVSIRPFDL